MSAAPTIDPGMQEPPDYREAQSSAEFAALRRSHRSFAFPLTVAFLLWYLAYVLLSSYAGDFMAIKVVGHLNVAFVLGIAQFATTFLIAWWYSRHATAKLDPKAEAIKARLEGASLEAGTSLRKDTPRLEDPA